MSHASIVRSTTVVYSHRFFLWFLVCGMLLILDRLYFRHCLKNYAFLVDITFPLIALTVQFSIRIWESISPSQHLQTTKCNKTWLSFLVTKIVCIYACLMGYTVYMRGYRSVLGDGLQTSNYRNVNFWRLSYRWLLLVIFNRETYIFHYRMEPRTFCLPRSCTVSWDVTMQSTDICRCWKVGIVFPRPVFRYFMS
jgi:hypothetical protein